MGLITLSSCKQEDTTVPFPELKDNRKYYSEEIVPLNFLGIYSIWKFVAASGGFSGMGHEPDYDYLIMSSFGMYALVRNDSIFEQGKIIVLQWDENYPGALPLMFVPDETMKNTSHFNNTLFYIYLEGSSKMHLMAQCCDFFNYHYTRVSAP